MRTAVVYFSRTGSTQKVTEAIAQAIGSTYCSITDYPAQQSADLLFIGGAIYGGQIDPELVSFIERLSAQNVGRAAVFATYAYPGPPEVMGRAEAMIKAALKKRGIPVVSQSFRCRGCFLIFGRKRPDEASLRDAGAFAAAVLAGA